MQLSIECTVVRFASLLSIGFITAKVVILPEKKLVKYTSVECIDFWQKTLAFYLGVIP